MRGRALKEREIKGIGGKKQIGSVSRAPIRRREKPQKNTGIETERGVNESAEFLVISDEEKQERQAAAAHG